MCPCVLRWWAVTLVPSSLAVIVINVKDFLKAVEPEKAVLGNESVNTLGWTHNNKGGVLSGSASWGQTEWNKCLWSERESCTGTARNATANLMRSFIIFFRYYVVCLTCSRTITVLDYECITADRNLVDDRTPMTWERRTAQRAAPHSASHLALCSITFVISFFFLSTCPSF